MKLATFNFRGEDRIGIARGDSGIIDLAAALGDDARVPSRAGTGPKERASA